MAQVKRVTEWSGLRILTMCLCVLTQSYVGPVPTGRIRLGEQTIDSAQTDDHNVGSFFVAVTFWPEGTGPTCEAIPFSNKQDHR